MRNKLYVIGKPIKHSRSPIIHNFWIKKYSLNAIYDKLEVDKTEIKDLIQQVRDGNIQGFNVTIPYKSPHSLSCRFSQDSYCAGKSGRSLNASAVNLSASIPKSGAVLIKAILLYHLQY